MVLKGKEKLRDVNNSLLWLMVIIILAGGFVAHYYFSSQPLPYHLIGGILVAALASLVFSRTSQGGQVVGFAKQSRTELRKVVWPTRQETVQSTMVIVVAVLLVGFFIWALDSVLLKVVAFLTGQGG